MGIDSMIFRHEIGMQTQLSKGMGGAFNQEKALVGAFTVIVKSSDNLRLKL